MTAAPRTLRFLLLVAAVVPLALPPGGEARTHAVAAALGAMPVSAAEDGPGCCDTFLPAGEQPACPHMACCVASGVHGVPGGQGSGLRSSPPCRTRASEPSPPSRLRPRSAEFEPPKARILFCSFRT